MPPSNTTPGTATVISSLPYTTTQDPTGSSPDTTYVPPCNSSAIHLPLWFTYTPTPGITALGFHFNRTSPGSYDPVLTAWQGTPPTLTLVVPSGPTSCFSLWDANGGYASLNVAPGTTYYFQLSDDSGVADAQLLFEVTAQMPATAPIGSFLVTNDQIGFPAVLLNRTTGAVLQVFGFPASEQGDWLPDGTLAILAETPTTPFLILNVYDSQLTLLRQVSSWITAPYDKAGPITSNGVDTWYVVGQSESVPSPFCRVYQITVGGTVVTSWDIWTAVGGTTGTNRAQGIAVEPDGSVLYFLRRRITVGGSELISVGRWDLVSNVPLSDAVPGNPLWTDNGRDLFRLADGSLLFYTTDTVLRYTTGGTLLNTYPLSGAGSTPRLRPDPSDATVFWVMHWPSGPTGGLPAHFTKIRLSDGAVLADVVTTIVEPGHSAGPPQFGPSQCCPLLLNPLAITGGGGGGTTGTIVVQKTATPATAALFDFTAGGGLTPTSFSLPDGGTQTFTAVPVGSGYSVTETGPAGWTVGYSVSNGSPQTNLGVAAGETVIVTVSNANPPPDAPLTYVIRRLRRFALPWDEANRKKTLQRLELIGQVGLGDATTTDPVIMLRLSKDGGYTWSNEIHMHVGKIGEYLKRVYVHRLGQGRNWVVELTSTDPVAWAWVECLVDLEAGPS
jgi:hypothetical protein